MEKDNNIAIVGHICLDITPKIESFDKGSLQAGSLYACNGIDIAIGGATANTGIALKKLGNENVVVYAQTGQDQFGATISGMLKETGIHSVLSIDEQVATSYSIIIAKKGIDRIFFHDPGANNTFTSSCISFKTLESISLLHFGYPPMMKAMRAKKGIELKKLFFEAKKYNCTTSLDMCMPDTSDTSTNWPTILQEILPYIDVFIPSIEESLYMIDKDRYVELKNECGTDDFVDFVLLSDLHNLGNRILAAGVGVAAIKCGKTGYYVRTANQHRIQSMGKLKPILCDNWSNRELFIPAVTVSQVVSATGAGDASIAGFLQALINGESIEDTIAIASATGALATQSFDAVSALIPYSEIKKTIEYQKYDKGLSLQKGWRKHGPLLYGPDDFFEVKK